LLHPNARARLALAMKYRTKLIVLFAALAAGTSLLLGSLQFLPARDALRRQLESTALSIAATTAASIDGDLHKTLQHPDDQAGPVYAQLEAIMRKARDANRRDDVDVKFIFSLAPDPANPPGRAGSVASAHDLAGDRSEASAHNFRFVVDAEEPGPDKSNLGDAYTFEGDEVVPVPWGHFQVQPSYIEDEWGTWLEAYAPIRDRAGNTVGVLGVDIRASDIEASLRSLLMHGLLAFAVSVLAGIGLALVVARWMARPLRVVSDALEAIGKGDLTTRVHIATKDEFGDVARAINTMVVGLRQRENLRSSLVRYVSNHVADKILSSGETPTLTGERRRITVLFSDVRGFTTLSEKMPPEEVVALLNSYFERMIDIVFKHEGTLDKFIGDGLMAFFGAPQNDPHHEAHAVRAALDMRVEMAKLQERWMREKQLDIRIGIGIHTGYAVVGNIGSDLKMQYTAIGDTVNLSARLESASKELGTDIIVSEDTRAAIADEFAFQALDSIRVKGRETPISVYSVEPR